MRILSQEETGAIGRPRRTSMSALHPKEEDDRIAADGKECSFITESIGRTHHRNEAIGVVRAGLAGCV